MPRGRGEETAFSFPHSQGEEERSSPFATKHDAGCRFLFILFTRARKFPPDPSSLRLFILMGIKLSQVLFLHALI